MCGGVFLLRNNDHGADVHVDDVSSWLVALNLFVNLCGVMLQCTELEAQLLDLLKRNKERCKLFECANYELGSMQD